MIKNKQTKIQITNKENDINKFVLYLCVQVTMTFSELVFPTL